jgi:hypothetical protein
MVRLLVSLIIASTAAATTSPTGHTLEFRAFVLREWFTAMSGGSDSYDYHASTITSDIPGLSVRLMSPISEHLSIGLNGTYGPRFRDPNRRMTSYSAGKSDRSMEFTIGVPVSLQIGTFVLGIQPMYIRGPYELEALLGPVCGMVYPRLSSTLYDGERFDRIGTLGIEFEGGVLLSGNVTLNAAYRLAEVKRRRGVVTDKSFVKGVSISIGYRTNRFTCVPGLSRRRQRFCVRSTTILEHFPEAREEGTHQLGGSSVLTLVSVAYLLPIDPHSHIGISGIMGTRSSDPNGEYVERTSADTYGFGVPVTVDIWRVTVGIMQSYTRGPFRIGGRRDTFSDGLGRYRDRYENDFAWNVTMSVGLHLTDQLICDAVYRRTYLKDWLDKKIKPYAEGFGVSIAYRFVP